MRQRRFVRSRSCRPPEGIGVRPQIRALDPRAIGGQGNGAIAAEWFERAHAMPTNSSGCLVPQSRPSQRFSRVPVHAPDRPDIRSTTLRSVPAQLGRLVKEVKLISR